MDSDQWRQIHPDFKWNGQRYSKKQLLCLSDHYRQSKTPHLQEIGRFFIAWLDDRQQIEVQTSGSTGAPQKMSVKKQYMVNSAMATNKFFDLPAKTTALLCLPATYIAGKLMLVRALVLGWEMDSVRPQSNPLNALQKTYDFCAMTPYQLQHSFVKLHHIKKIMVGGGMLSKTLFQRLQSLPSKIYETYAMTETLTHIAARQINGLTKPQLPPFRLLDQVSITQDKQHCLIIKAPKVSEKIIHTHDIVELVSPTQFYLKGRLDNVINTGGIKVHPEEVEQQLGPYINTRFFVYGITDEVLGEKVVLFIEGNPNQEELQALRQHIKGSTTLGPYQRPKEIFTLQHFVETHSGKIKRQATANLIHS